jgi:predicted secreted protein
MAITSAIVLYAVVWFMVMFIVLPIGRRTQGDDGDVVPGTQPGAPVNFDLKRTIIIVSSVALVIWAVICAVIISGVISIRDLGWV